MIQSTAENDVVIAELLDITPSLVPLCRALGTLSREWDEARGSILAFVRDNAPELTEREQQLVVRCLIALQPPIIDVLSASLTGPNDGRAEN